VAARASGLALPQHNTLVASTDVTAEERWPDLASMLRPDGVRAALGLPVRLGGVTVGTLDVCYDHPHVWQDDECQALARYRDVVESTLATAVAAHNAGELAVDAMTAFDRLRRAARDTQTKIGDVAQRLVSTGRLPTEASRSANL
jgi:GAF domain-containing protein